MIRDLKVLGVALVAVLAMGGVGASGAWGASFTSGAEPTTLTAAGFTSEQLLTLTGTNSQFVCKEINFAAGSTVKATAAEITAVPVYSNDCTVTIEGNTLEAKVDTEGCAYVYTAVAQTTSGVMHIECPEKKVIKVTAFIAGTFRECLDIHAQTPTVPTIEYHNTTAIGNHMDILITSKVEGITYEKTELCKGAANNEANDATYSGSITVRGDNGSGTFVDVTVS